MENVKTVNINPHAAPDISQVISDNITKHPNRELPPIDANNEDTPPVVDTQEAPPTGETESNENFVDKGVDAQVDTKTESQEEIDFSKRMAYLAKQQKMYEEKRKADKEEEAKFRAEMEAWKADRERYSKEEEEYKSNPMKALERYGLTIDDIIQHGLGEEPQKEEEAPLDAKSEIEKIREEFKNQLDEYKKQQEEAAEAAKREAEEARTKEQEAAIESHKKRISDTLSQEAEKYELINFQGANDLVWEITNSHFDQTGKVLEPAQAAEMAESYLEKQVDELMKIGKIAAKFKSVSEPTTTESSEKDISDALSQQSQVKAKAPESEKPSNLRQTTLTSDFAGVPTTSTSKPLTKEESLRQAAKMLKFN